VHSNKQNLVNSDLAMDSAHQQANGPVSNADGRPPGSDHEQQLYGGAYYGGVGNSIGGQQLPPPDLHGLQQQHTNQQFSDLSHHHQYSAAPPAERDRAWYGQGFESATSLSHQDVSPWQQAQNPPRYQVQHHPLYPVDRTSRDLPNQFVFDCKYDTL
jgi:hypothetical protein